ncbi:MAG: hypothetical protein PHY57_09455 [Ignavibacterium sp.]|jgi:hypothetical protein|nr:MAG: DUF3810 domain-containing protein [Ignavibacterium sp.]MDD5608727.1 hypothetical protein [Ignavibacterium sp.]
MLTEILIIGLILTSLVMVVIGILSIKEKFVRKYFLFVALLTAVFFTATLIVNAQEKPEEKKETKMTMQHEDMQKCMDKIAADSTMRMQMMDKMMKHTKGDSSGMMQMCKMMMDNPEMHKMMMKMMHGEGMMNGMMKHDMKDEKSDSQMKNGETEHKSHH